MDHKTVDFKINKAFEEGDKGIIEGFASTFNNEDLVKDIILPGAFTKSLKRFQSKKQVIPLLFGHNDRELPLGGLDPDKSFENEKGLNVSGAIDLDTQRGKETFSLLKKGFLNSFSIGFIGRDFTFRKGGGSVFKELDLLEVSIVNVPANRSALINEVKTVTPFKDLPLAPIDRRWDKNAAIPRIREHTGSTESPSSSYRNAFLWYDAENPGDFGSYKLPYADVIDGQLKAVPRAIFAAAGALQGARGGVKIPPADVEKIKGNLNKYYEKMGRPSPFKDKDSDNNSDDKDDKDDNDNDKKLFESLQELNKLFDIQKLFN